MCGVADGGRIRRINAKELIFFPRRSKASFPADGAEAWLEM
jgi:hypothetical protein